MEDDNLATLCNLYYVANNIRYVLYMQMMRNIMREIKRI